MDYSNHTEVLRMLSESQEADDDNRNRAREAHLFVDKRDGQWEPHVWNSMNGRPRYTFDVVGPIVDVIAGEMDKADFEISVSPAGAGATKDNAKLLNGMIRNIERVSGAETIYRLAGRNMVTAGIDGWMVRQDYIDENSFDQCLVIDGISNFVDSVWFGPYKKPDASDAKWCVVLEAMNKDEYRERYPDSSGLSVGDGKFLQAYYKKHDQIIIANIYYVEEKQSEIAKLQDGRIIDVDESKDIIDELDNLNQIVDRRKRKKRNVKSRLFDGGGWLNDQQDTVFSSIPVIPAISDFKVIENKVVYKGVVERLMDPARVRNYSLSREIEEGSLAPRAKYWMTKKQSQGHEKTLATLNTNADPMQHYNNDPEVPGPPQQQGGAQINPGLQKLSADMDMAIQKSAGLFAPSMGENPGLQSGVAIEMLQDKGDIGTVKFFSAMETAKCRMANILIDAIPKVYSTERQERILKEDGSFDMTRINQPAFDPDTTSIVIKNDLSKGKYDVSCSSGPSFSNRKDRTVKTLIDIGQIDPSSIQLGGDILFNNLDTPGMDLISERKRNQLFQSGAIPESQMTDEEKQILIQQQSQPQQPDAGMILAQAEVDKAQAQANKVMVDAQVAQSREARENAKAQSDIQKQEFDEVIQMQKQQMDMQRQIVESQETLANTLKLLQESMSNVTIVTPEMIDAVKNTAKSINQA